MSKNDISIKLPFESWDHLIKDSALWGDTSKGIVRDIEKQLNGRMSRTRQEKDPEAVVLNPLMFAAEHGKIFCVSSKDKEPIECLLPCLAGNIVIFTTFTPNIQGIEVASQKGLKKEVTMVKVHDFINAMLVIDRFKDAGINHFILDRWDEIGMGGRSKAKAGALRTGSINMLPTKIGKANYFFTTMMGDPGLYEKVDTHYAI
jgi:hypothetical protein